MSLCFKRLVLVMEDNWRPESSGQGYLDHLCSLGDISSRFQDVVLEMSIDGFAVLQLGYCAALKLICVKIC